MGPSQNKTPPPAMSSACLLSIEKFQSKNKFNHRSEKMQPHSTAKKIKQNKILKNILKKKGENAERKENSQTRPNNNSLGIKKSQGPLVPP